MNEPKETESQGEQVRELAEAIADRTPVEWQDREVRDARLAPSLRGLRAIDRIASVYGAFTPDLLADATGGGESSSAAEVPVEAPVLFTWKHLRVIEKLGAGTAGEVFRAVDPHLDREVALKLRALPRADGAERYLDEARRLARVRHPNVLTVFGADVADGRVGLWCELLRGRTMEERLAEDGPLGADEAILVGLELTRALAAVHAAGLVHGDIKAANVMRRDGGGVVLLDFSSVREIPPDRGSRSGSRGDGRLTGTPLTLAPEVLRGDGASVAGDVYALGVLLYRLVSGRYPVAANTWDELIAAHARADRSGPGAPLRDVRPDLSGSYVRVVERALARSPEDRFGSAGEMERALEGALRPDAVLRAENVGARADGASARAGADRSPAGTQRRRMPTIAWFGIAATMVALVLPSILGRERATPPAAITDSPGEDARPTDDATGGATGGATGVTGVAGATEGALPAATTAVPVTPALRVDASLYRATYSGAQPVITGGLVRPDDQLFLEITGDRSMHVYVLDEDDHGELFVLFPVTGLEPANPLAPGVRHRLPGTRDGVSQDWTVTSAGGRETLLIVASSRPLSMLETRIAGFPTVEASNEPVYAQLDPAALEGLRGIAGLSPSREPGAPAGRRLAELEATYRSLAEQRKDIWVHIIELANPG